MKMAPLSPTSTARPQRWANASGRYNKKWAIFIKQMFWKIKTQPPFKTEFKRPDSLCTANGAVWPWPCCSPWRPLKTHPKSMDLFKGRTHTPMSLAAGMTSDPEEPSSMRSRLPLCDMLATHAKFQDHYHTSFVLQKMQKALSFALEQWLSRVAVPRPIQEYYENLFAPEDARAESRPITKHLLFPRQLATGSSKWPEANLTGRQF